MVGLVNDDGCGSGSSGSNNNYRSGINNRIIIISLYLIPFTCRYNFDSAKSARWFVLKRDCKEIHITYCTLHCLVCVAVNPTKKIRQDWSSRSAPRRVSRKAWELNFTVCGLRQTESEFRQISDN